MTYRQRYSAIKTDIQTYRQRASGRWRGRGPSVFTFLFFHIFWSSFFIFLLFWPVENWVKRRPNKGPKSHQKSTKNRSKIDQKSAKNRSKIGQKSVKNEVKNGVKNGGFKNRQKIGKKLSKNRQKIGKKSAIFGQKSSKSRPRNGHKWKNQAKWPVFLYFPVYPAPKKGSKISKIWKNQHLEQGFEKRALFPYISPLIKSGFSSKSKKRPKNLKTAKTGRFWHIFKVPCFDSIFWSLFHWFLVDFWRFFGDFLMIFWRFFGDFLMIFWWFLNAPFWPPLFDNFLDPFFEWCLRPFPFFCLSLIGELILMGMGLPVFLFFIF